MPPYARINYSRCRHGRGLLLACVPYCILQCNTCTTETVLHYSPALCEDGRRDSRVLICVKSVSAETAAAAGGSGGQHVLVSYFMPS